MIEFMKKHEGGFDGQAKILEALGGASRHVLEISVSGQTGG